MGALCNELASVLPAADVCPFEMWHEGRRHMQRSATHCQGGLRRYDPKWVISEVVPNATHCIWVHVPLDLWGCKGVGMTHDPFGELLHHVLRFQVTSRVFD